MQSSRPLRTAQFLPPLPLPLLGVRCSGPVLVRHRPRGTDLAGTPALPAARMQLDKAAANRFITAAINRASSAARPAGSEATSAEEDDAEAGPSGTHTRFTEEEKKDLDRLLEPEDDDDDEEKERAGSDAEDEDSDGVVEEMLRGPGGAGGKKRSPKGKEAAERGAAQGKTAKRKAIDPFAGTFGLCFPVRSRRQVSSRLMNSGVYRLRPAEASSFRLRHLRSRRTAVQEEAETSRNRRCRCGVERVDCRGA